MDAFEALVALLLHREGYWTTTSFRVDLTKEEKRKIGRASSPRWEIDVVAYKATTNEVLVVECKSFLDSTGVIFRGGTFEPEKRYKLFTDGRLRRIVLNRLARQLLDAGACTPEPLVTLCLATGNLAKKSDRNALGRHFNARGWRLLDDHWIRGKLANMAGTKYENDIAHVVAKLLLRSG